MNFQLFRRRTVLLPTLLGWTCLLALAASTLSFWWFRGESFLSRTDRRSAEVLVVEGWVGIDCPEAVAAEMRQGCYRWAVIAGGLTGNPWSQQRWNRVEETQQGLLRLGIPNEQIIGAPTGDPVGQRTFEMAVAARRAIQSRGITVQTINVFTRGVHARRSRLVFAKVFGSSTSVGVISWVPPSYQSRSWWKSSERAEDFLKETVGYAFELLLNSGRWSNAPAGNGGGRADYP